MGDCGERKEGNKEGCCTVPGCCKGSCGCRTLPASGTSNKEGAPVCMCACSRGKE